MISVIVPVYNVEQYLRQCLDSILNQTYSDLEILLIDDGSSDGSGAICDEYAEKDNRVRAFHTENRGVSAARNLGLREAKGEYIGFVDSDDWLEPEFYELLLDRLLETGADISVGGVRFEYPGRTIESSLAQDAVLSKAEALEWLLLKRLKDYPWNKLYRRELWEGITFPEGRVYEDVATAYKLILKTDRVVSLSNRLFHYRQRNNGITATNTMNNLSDCWHTFYDRYMELKEYPGIKENDELVGTLKEDVAKCSIRTWWWVYRIPEIERNAEHLKEVSRFMREEYPPFGEPGWGRFQRLFAFLTRYDNAASYAAGYYLNKLYRLRKKL